MKRINLILVALVVLFVLPMCHSNKKDNKKYYTQEQVDSLFSAKITFELEISEKKARNYGEIGIW